ncbi:MAG: hypothetical protein H0Z24_09090 [Thermosipho sp. (in: Bacteria)]|nr:hypothetical protein [Thermosipho sp. (in: thermotogales)]
MIPEDFTTSLYTCENVEKFPNMGVLKKSVFEFIKTIGKNLIKKGFIINEESKRITFYINPIGIVSIDYKLNYIPQDKVILLSFYPRGSGKGLDPKNWRRDYNFNVALRVLEFCDSLGDTINVSVEEYGEVNFNRVYLNEYLNIRKWRVSLFGEQEVALDYVLNNRKLIYNLLLNHSKERIYTFVLFSHIFHETNIDRETRKNAQEAIEILKQELQKFGDVDGVYDSINFKYVLETYSKKNDTIVIFIETEDVIGSMYKNFKKYLDVNRIPSQFISIETILEKFRKWPGVRLNFLLELFNKINESKPLFLKPIPYLYEIDGVLCLSDIKDASIKSLQKLFGALFMYTEPGIYEEVHIYEDIPYNIQQGQIVFENEDGIRRLVEYVYQLGGEDTVTMDIFLTRPWKKKHLNQFITQLMKVGYKVNRVYYLSTVRSRFVDETLLNNLLRNSSAEYRIPSKVRYELDDYWHYYYIVSNKVAFIRTSTQLRIYPNLFNLFVYLLWPESGSLSKADLEKILWFTKKRLYRFQEFFVTKYPEPIWIFKNLRKLYLGEVDERIRIPLRLMI